MQESKRQKQVAGLLNEELSDIFQRLGFNIIDGGMISISKVTVTPDLYEVRVYLSFFQIKDPEAMLQRQREEVVDDGEACVSVRPWPRVARGDAGRRAHRDTGRGEERA